MIETEAHAIDTGLGKSEYEKALHATPPHTCSVILYVEVGFTFNLETFVFRSPVFGRFFLPNRILN